MANATAISIVGIVVSGIAGPTISAYWSEKRLARERRAALADADLHELRSLFADCLKLMLDARLGLITTRLAIESGALDPIDSAAEDEGELMEAQEAREEFSELQNLNTVMLQEYPRLLLMLGVSHPVVESFHKASSILTSALDAPADLIGGDLARDEASAKLNEGMSEFSAEVSRFIAACEPVAKRKSDVVS